MSPDLQSRLSEIAAELERGQAEQPLAEFIATHATDFRGASRAILVRLAEASAERSLVGGAAGATRRLAIPDAKWDWLVVADAAAALADVSAWNELVAFSPLVVIVGPADAVPTATTRALLAALADARKRGVLLLTGAATAGPMQGIPAAFLPALKRETFDPAGDWSSDGRPASLEFREHVRLWLEGFAVERAALPLGARVEQLRQRAMAQRAALDQRQTALMAQRDAGGQRARVDRAREACLQALETQEKELVEDSRLFLTAKGDGTTKLKTVIDRTGSALVHEEMKPKVCVLTLDEDEVRRLLKQVEAIFWSHAKHTIEKADRAVAATLTEFGQELRAVFPEAVPPTATALEQARITKGIEPMLHANIAYRGELPVKGFFERIQASRQVVFLVVGLLSLAGASAFARSPAVILVTLALFSIMLFKTARDFREEAAETKERELQRLLELLRTNLRQLLQELETVRLNVWRDHLQGQRRAVAAALEQAAREATARQVRDIEEERQKIQLKLRAADKLLRDLGTLEQRLQGVVMPVRQSRTKAELAFGQALRT